jgi:hypothetical protein
MSIGLFDVEMRHGGIDGDHFFDSHFRGWIFVRIRGARIYLAPTAAPPSGAVCLSSLSS